MQNERDRPGMIAAGDRARAEGIAAAFEQRKLEEEQRYAELNKRLDSLVSSVASTDRISRTVRNLTWGLFVLTVIILFLTAYLAYDAKEKAKSEQPKHEGTSEEAKPNQ